MELIANMNYNDKVLFFKNDNLENKIKVMLASILMKSGFFEVIDINLDVLVIIAVVLNNNIKIFESISEQMHEFKDQEISKLDLKDVKICLSHQLNMEVGIIKKSWQIDNGSLLIIATIDKQSKLFSFIKHALLNGYYAFVSMQHIASLYSNIIKKRVLEVSLCSLPRRANTDILFHFIVNKDDISIYCNMSVIKEFCEKNK